MVFLPECPTIISGMTKKASYAFARIGAPKEWNPIWAAADFAARAIPIQASRQARAIVTKLRMN
ncbi:hypothetical protein CPY51_20230 [Rhizobium tubonense]|uniref:Uncharacterized protein n=1 Tax=Rhizobium tubonense TaxID=484088 RepID=A0A2W4CEB9_9HYPH|nr:hypothetical protein CPY51_20230 [Rhizobium tubonense]